VATSLVDLEHLQRPEESTPPELALLDDRAGAPEPDNAMIVGW
jgi:hypothetical protein